MQTKNLKKKGFTLVELVIVVAVIAVLSAILIPTIGCFVEEAKETNDMATVRLLNTALVEDEASNGKSATMTDALAAMAKKGYLVDRLTPRSTGEILWDSVSNRFMLVKGDEVLYRDNSIAGGQDYQLWKVLNNGDNLSETYSNYLKDGYVFNSTTPISTGLDVGNNTGITAIKYENTSGTAKSVIIRTNGGQLTVNAPLDTVNHHGEAQNVDIKNVDLQNSYHEFGEVGYVEIAKGHFVAEANSVVIALVNTGAATEVKLDAAASADVKVAFTTNESAKESAHGGNLALTYRELTTDEKKELIYNAEAQAMNAIAVKGKYFKTVKDAFDRVKKVNGEGYNVAEDVTIVLYRDIQEDGFVIESGNTVIFDFNGHTYDVNGTVGSVGTTTNGFQLHKDSTITFKNGTLKSSKAYILIQNYSNLTLDNMVISTVEAKSGSAGSYAVSNNNGIVTIKDTTIEARSGKYAFDVCRYSTYRSVHITVKGNSVINGKIEISASSGNALDGFSLTLESGDFSKASIVVDRSVSTLISENIIKKSSSIGDITVTSGYAWSEAEDGYQKLVKAN